MGGVLEGEVLARGTGTVMSDEDEGTGTAVVPWGEVLAQVLAQGEADEPAFAQGYRVEFFWRRRGGRRWAYFHYRRGRGRKRSTDYGGSIRVACERHPERVRDFLRRTQWVPENLPEEWKAWANESKAAMT